MAIELHDSHGSTLTVRVEFGRVAMVEVGPDGDAWSGLIIAPSDVPEVCRLLTEAAKEAPTCESES